MIIIKQKSPDKNIYWITSMAQRQRSMKNTLLLSKGKKKQLYNNQQPVSCLTMSTSVDLEVKIKPNANNFILANKKNLHNFFKDRIPQDKIFVGQKPPSFSPSKIFKLRRQQNQRQQSTKIKLHRSFDPEQQLFKTPSTKKMNKTFLLNEKSKQISLNSISQTSKNIKLQSVASTYQTPTSSSLVKRCQTVKKQAYISVFGDKLIQEKSRMLEIESATNLTMYQNESQQLKPEQQKPRPKTNLNCSRLTQQKQKLGKLLQKMQGFASFVNPYRLKAPQNPQQKPTYENATNFHPTQFQKNELVDWIKAISTDYKQKNYGFKANRMKTLEDIQKMDPAYYTKMKMHKNGRLWTRNKALNGIKVEEGLGRLQNMEELFKLGSLESKREEFLDQLLTITDRNNNTIDIDRQQLKPLPANNPKLPKPPKQNFPIFSKNLIKTANLAKLYQISCDKIYVSLWKKRKPYELEGSYAFFKYIKHNNVKLVENFVGKNQEYAHQVDYQYRTGLVYAVQNGAIDVVRFLVRFGVNVDARTAKGLTALIYAIINGNYEAAQCILQAGASPWSTNHYNLAPLLQKSPKKFQTLLKNARKIHIARSLIRKLRCKDEFWLAHRGKIQGNQPITF